MKIRASTGYLECNIMLEQFNKAPIKQLSSSHKLLDGLTVKIPWQPNLLMIQRTLQLHVLLWCTIREAMQKTSER